MEMVRKRPLPLTCGRPLMKLFAVRTQWLTLIMACFFGTLVFIIVPETYAPVLLARRAKRLRHETGNWALHAKHEERRVDLKEIAQRYLTRPTKMMFQEPILALLTIYLAFIFGEHYNLCRTHFMCFPTLTAC